MTKEHHTGNLYWPNTLAFKPSYPQLEGHKTVKAAIIGGGMSGILCGLVLARSGISACILERNEIAHASTSANTGLLQFCNDVMLSQLSRQIGERAAVQFYQACRNAVEQLSAVAASLAVETGFKRRSSLYFASTEADLPRLQAEYESLHKAGLPVEYWKPGDISSHFPFAKPGAIMTRGDAEVNPYQLVHAMAREAAVSGLDIWENTEIAAHTTATSGLHRLEAANGSVVEAEHVIYAVGYEPEELRGKLISARINRSFAAVTGVQTSLARWHQRMMIWETARPYMYLRTTPERRVVIGGLDENISEPILGKHARSRLADKLSHKLEELFPMLDCQLEYGWSASFGESSDNLPFIGRDPAWERVYYCLGYGGNGTIYSMLAASIIRDFIQGTEHPIAHIVSLNRPGLAELAT